MIELSIIIPSYNTKEMTMKCLGSLGNLGTLETEIIVVDNGSKDGTIGEIREIRGIRVIENKENLGFAKAINQGLKEAKGKYVLLLNSDTVVEKGTVEKMMEYLESNSQVGVVGCQLRNSDGSVQSSGGYLPNLFNLAAWSLFLDDLPWVREFFPAYHVKSKSFYLQEQFLGWVSGAFFLTKKEVIEKVGLFDEKMFMYVEEVDWCERVKNNGYGVVFNPEAWITHEKGGSGEHNKAGIIEEFNGLKYFFQKHKEQWQSLILKIILKTAIIARIFLFGIILRDTKKREVYVKAFKLV